MPETRRQDIVTQQSQSIPEYLPHIIVLSVLFIVEYWVFMTHASTLIGAGDYGPFVGIPMIVAMAILMLGAIGFYSICGGTQIYKRIISISLVLFIIQVGLIFLEYVVVATSL